MDIWAWVEAAREGLPNGEEELARRIRRLPGWVTNQHHARVDAVVPEMVAAARRLNRPWIEVFVRHWQLQSLVFHRQEITRSLPEAIDLLERAHREDAIGCPQSVCVAQDVCASYGFADGPGYAERRVAVSEETLARIDPTWPCFHCITSERVGGLLDLGRYAEALEAVEAASNAMRDAGQPVDTGDFAWSRADALRNLGRVDEALQVVERAQSPPKGRGFEREKQLLRVLYLTLLDRLEEAEAAFPPFEDVADTASLFDYWAEAAYELGRRGSDRIGPDEHRGMAIAAHQLLRQGCPREAFEIAVWGAELCAVSGRKALGEGYLRLAERARQRLVADCGAAQALARVVAQVDAVEDARLPDDWEAFQESIRADGVQFDDAVAGIARWPERHGLALSVARFWRRAGFPGEARAVTERVLAATPDDPEVWLDVGETLRDERDWARLERLIDDAPATAALQAGWLRHFLLEARGDRDGAIAALDALMDHPSAGVGIPVRKAALCRDAGRWQDALEALDRGVQMGMEPGPPDWDRIVAATLLGEHDKVRESCARLGIELESDAGPIEEDWGIVRLRYPDDEGRHSWGIRTGPVTAGVVSIHGPGPERERNGDRVVFQPLPLDEDREYPLFGVVRVVQEGKRQSFAVDGPHPGDAELRALRANLESLGAATRATHSSHYQLTDPDHGGELPGCYVRVALPAGDVELQRAVDARLTRFVEQTGVPLVWLDLVEALGDPERLAEQRALAERWGIA